VILDDDRQGCGQHEDHGLASPIRFEPMK